jgi:hypothetical protein
VPQTARNQQRLQAAEGLPVREKTFDLLQSIYVPSTYQDPRKQKGAFCSRALRILPDRNLAESNLPRSTASLQSLLSTLTARRIIFSLPLSLEYQIQAGNPTSFQNLLFPCFE